MALLGEGFSTSWVCWLRGELFSFFRVGWSLLGANAPFTSPNQPSTRSNHPPSPGFQEGALQAAGEEKRCHETFG